MSKKSNTMQNQGSKNFTEYLQEQVITLTQDLKKAAIFGRNLSVKNKELVDFNEKLRKKLSKVKLIKEAMNNLRIKNDTLEASLHEFKSKYLDLKVDFESLHEVSEQNREKYKVIENENSVILKNNTEYRRQIKQKDNKISQIEKENEDLNEKIVSLSNNISQSPKKEKKSNKKEKDAKIEALRLNDVISKLQNQIEGNEVKLLHLKMQNGKEIKMYKMEIEKLTKINNHCKNKISNLSSKQVNLLNLYEKKGKLVKDKLYSYRSFLDTTVHSITSNMKKTVKMNEKLFNQEIEKLKEMNEESQQSLKKEIVLKLKEMDKLNDVENEKMDLKDRIQSLENNNNKLEKMISSLREGKKEGDVKMISEIGDMEKKIGLMKNELRQKTKENLILQEKIVQIEKNFLIQIELLQSQLEIKDKNIESIDEQKHVSESENKTLEEKIKCVKNDLKNASAKTVELQKVINEIKSNKEVEKKELMKKVDNEIGKSKLHYENRLLEYETSIKNLKLSEIGKSINSDMKRKYQKIKQASRSAYLRLFKLQKEVIEIKTKEDLKDIKLSINNSRKKKDKLKDEKRIFDYVFKENKGFLIGYKNLQIRFCMQPNLFKIE